MAVYLTNSFEEGTSGTTISTANSAPAAGAGNAFNAVSIGASATLTFDNGEAAHGSLSAKFVTPASAVNVLLEWTTSLTGSSLSQVWVRAYCYFAANPSGNLRLIRFMSGGTMCGCIQISSAGKVVTLNAAGTPQTTSTASIPTGVWFRLEGYCIGSATAGQVQVSLYDTPDSTTPTETDTTGSALNTSGTINAVHFGNPSSVASQTFWLDDVGASDTAYLGPSQITGAGSAGLTLAAAAAGTRAQSGAGAAALTLAVSAAGQRRQQKAASAGLMLAAVATGLSKRSGSPAAGLALAAAAAGSRRQSGSPHGALMLAAAATGHVVVTPAASTPMVSPATASSRSVVPAAASTPAVGPATVSSPTVT